MDTGAAPTMVSKSNNNSWCRRRLGVYSTSSIAELAVLVSTVFAQRRNLANRIKAKKLTVLAMCSSHTTRRSLVSARAHRISRYKIPPPPALPSCTVNDAGTSTEAVLRVSYQPLAVFRVRPVTRCTSTMPGHTEAVLHVSYSPDGSMLASGGGDMTVR